MSSNITIENLFEKSRFPQSSSELIGVIIYFPFGVILAVIRAFIALNALCLTIISSNYPRLRRPLLRIMCGVLGLIVVEKKNSVPKKSQVIVSNHLSIFDHIALYLVTDSFTPTKKLSGSSALFFGLLSLLNNDNVASESSIIKQFLSTGKSLLLFPEGTTTNGKYALLKFATSTSIICDKLQPIVITIKRPYLSNINFSVLGCSQFTEIFWFFFVPFTKFEYKILPVVERLKDDSNETMMSRVEIAISQELKISTSNFTKSDKAEFEKKYLLELSNERKRCNKQLSSDNTEEDPDIVRMALQVSDVLPYVPNNVIIANLKRTRSVDITITNILDGTVKYIPLKQPSREQKPVVKKIEYNNFEVASFVERKAKLIDEARKRYIKKHGLHHLV
ncbi:lipid droplet-regulating VLDL assembly factor AUP1-like [Daktulosphaira vitifoliae]|uniref:lipid droplet-regulating VLDL assembly factor AUP1-like n=1 Tax=Daktulosphaira vitifoliae TaxID=58002 RepID=UPI0021AA2814|nr:lipid droplet-regulating VLDL assembly factor AUP1-like [Daktulosphaira vitifoliae]